MPARPYTAAVTKEQDPERDIVRELQEDANWSMWTNAHQRWRDRPRGPVPSDPGVRTFMLAAGLVVGVVLGAVALIVLLFKLS